MTKTSESEEKVIIPGWPSTSTSEAGEKQNETDFFCFILFAGPRPVAVVRQQKSSETIFFLFHLIRLAVGGSREKTPMKQNFFVSSGDAVWQTLRPFAAGRGESVETDFFCFN